MAVDTRLIQLILGAIGSLAILWVLAPAASADCAKDVRGEVYCGGGSCKLDRRGDIWCSRSYKGGAGNTRDGRVVCGKGRCVQDSHGKVFCSSVVDGAVLIDRFGRVRCYGQCERATPEQCEHTPADSSR